ncbi:MAG: DUF2284 domain-containing protein [Lachnospiraceae bacterium]|nr:DUF2284 domain-containing protein [Lachnospiraceae bacterium]
MLKDELLIYMKKVYPEIQGIAVEPGKLIFEENVRMNCFYCGKYGNNWKCPPNLPDLDYPKMMKEYEMGLATILSMDITSQSDYNKIRNDSSVILHKSLLDLEKWLYHHNSSNAISFIGGSCKLCKGGCGKEKCNNPYMSRAPLEAIGVNIIKSMKQYGIDITFPTEKAIKRVGLLLWQEP